MIPYYKLTILDIDLNNKHTITNEAIEIMTHLGVNDDLGSFNIRLPATRDFTSNPLYSDVIPGDRVKLWCGWEAGYDAGDPDFYGRVSNVSSVSGATRVITGKSFSEILGRRIKARKVWVATEADDIVAEVASDLSLGAGEIAVDTTAITIEQDTETYLDIMRKVSDYWFNAGTQVKKDFYVDASLNLAWKARPIRTVGVETLTWGATDPDELAIKSYTRLTEGVNIKNAIGVYGNLTPFNPKDSEVYGRKNPQDGDSWTHSAWTDINGTTASSAVAPKIGSDCTRSTCDASNICQFYRTFTPFSSVGVASFGAVELWARRDTIPSSNHIKLYCPDNSNYYTWTYTVPSVNNVWEFRRASIGESNTYDVDTNPNGEWVATGSPTWETISGLEVYVGLANTFHYDVDGGCFNFGRWRYVPTSDATSIDDYDENDQIIIDDNLKSDGACESRAKTLLYQFKDPVTRLDIATIGSTNILRGDQLSITLPPENISAVAYYVVSVEQHINYPDMWQTTSTMLDTVSCRAIPTIREQETLARSIKNLQQVSRNQKRVN